MKHRMKICESAFFAIINQVGSQKAEMGGALFGSEKDMVIREFVLDTHARTSRSTYTINTEFLNPIIKDKWEKKRLSLIGILHSHPQSFAGLSSPDISYFTDLLKTIKREAFYAPIVFTIPDGGFQFFPFVFLEGNSKPVSAQLEIVPDDYQISKIDKNEKKNQNLIPVVQNSNIPESLEFPLNISILAHRVLGLATKSVLFLALVVFLVIVYPKCIQFILKILAV